MSAISPLDIALTLAARFGLPGFPCSASKRPAISEEDGGHGCLDATTDPTQLRALFARAPHARLVGIPTGPASGFDALDIDPRHGGDVWERDNRARLPETRIHATPGGGRHHLFCHHHGVRNHQAVPTAGVDVRGKGGYVIWPPSGGYAVIHDVAPAEWPEWLLDLIIRREPPTRPFVRTDPGEISDKRLDGLLGSLLDRLSRAPEGAKHDTLLRIARTLGGYAHLLGCADDRLVALMLGALPATVADWRNAEKTAWDGLRHGHSAPLDLEDRPLATPAPGERQAPFARLWDASAPLAGTVAAGWLEAIGLGHLIDCPELRFHPSCLHPDRVRLPALVAAVRALDGELIAVHRIYLHRDGKRLADIDTPRAVLGSPRGGAIRLASLEDVLTAGELVVGTDIEEVASLGWLLRRPAWATGTAANLAAGLALPAELQRVVIAAEPDGDDAAYAAWRRFKREGHSVEAAAPDGAASFNGMMSGGNEADG